jgi:hypothetical protein
VLTDHYGHQATTAAIDRALAVHQAAGRIRAWAYTDPERRHRRVELRHGELDHLDDGRALALSVGLTVGAEPAVCTHRCMQGRHCGGCGCPGCGYSHDAGPAVFTAAGDGELAAWLGQHRAGGGVVRNQDIAVLLVDAADAGMITGPDGWAFHVECVTNGDGNPEGWRIFIRDSSWPPDLHLATPFLEADEDAPGCADLIRSAAAEASSLLAAYRGLTR